jgi:hypothetical protein
MRWRIGNPRRALDRVFDFTPNTMPVGVTHVRPSSAFVFNALGTLIEVSPDAVAYDYDLITMLYRGALLEPARSNSIRNPRAEGGTSSALPSLWAVGSVAGITPVYAYGTDNGMPYIDIQITGTPTASGSYICGFEQTTQIVAAQGETWNNAFLYRLMAGGLNNVTVQSVLTERVAAGTIVATDFTTIFPNNAYQQFSKVRTLTAATTARAQPRLQINVTNGLAIDMRIRIALPQFELGSFLTSIMLPAVGNNIVSTRAANTFSIALPDGNYQRTVRLGTVNQSGTDYADNVVVAGGAHALSWSSLPVAAQAAGERHLQRVTMKRVA